MGLSMSIDLLSYVLWGLAWGTATWVVARNVSRRTRRPTPAWTVALPGRERWVRTLEYARDRVVRAGLRATLAAVFLLTAAGLALAGFLVGAVYFQNVPAGILLAVAGGLIPEEIVFHLQRLQEQRTYMGLVTAIQAFAVSFSVNRNPLDALASAAGATHEPVRSALLKAQWQLSSNVYREEVLADLDRALGGGYGGVFCRLLEAVLRDAGAGQLFAKLSYRLSQRRVLEERNEAALRAYRLIGLAFLCALPILYLGLLQWLPETYEYVTETVRGRLTILAAAMAVLGSLVMGRMTSGVEY